jgi:hypothetical protein
MAHLSLADCPQFLDLKEAHKPVHEEMPRLLPIAEYIVFVKSDLSYFIQFNAEIMGSYGDKTAGQLFACFSNSYDQLVWAAAPFHRYL